MQRSAIDPCRSITVEIMLGNKQLNFNQMLDPSISEALFVALIRAEVAQNALEYKSYS